MISGVYQILNTVTNKIYIGSTIDIDKRQREHFNLLKCDNYPNNYLQNAWNKYGADSFVFELLEATKSDKDSIIEKEQHYLDTLQPFGDHGYNICTVAYSCLGIKRSKETIRRLSEAKLGDKNPMYGRIVSAETRKKLSDAKSGDKHWSYGINRPEETIDKIRKGTSNKVITDVTKDKLSTSGKQAWSKRKSYSRRVSVNGEIYKSIRAAAEDLNVNKDTVSYRCEQDNYPYYKFITK